jgi:hypothetical protein
MPKDGIQWCSQYCLKQATSCLDMARLRAGSGHDGTFARLAAQWNQMAEHCNGRLHQWATWCRKQGNEE